MTTLAPLSTLVTLYQPDEPWARQRTRYTLQGLFQMDEGLAEEADAIRAAMAKREPFHGGGGAAPSYSIYPDMDLSSLVPADRLLSLDYDGLMRAYDGFLALTGLRPMSGEELLVEIECAGRIG